MGHARRSWNQYDLFSCSVSLLISKQRADSGFGSAHSPPLGLGKPLLLLCMASKLLPLRELLLAGLSPEFMLYPCKGSLLSHPPHAFTVSTVICSRCMSLVWKWNKLDSVYLPLQHAVAALVWSWAHPHSSSYPHTASSSCPQLRQP